MKAVLTIMILSCITMMAAQAKSITRVKTIGSSPKGQYIAFEEFGYQNESKSSFSKIRVMNVWKDKYVTKTIYIKSDKNNTSLKQVRAKAKKLVMKRLKKFNISS